MTLLYSYSLIMLSSDVESERNLGLHGLLPCEIEKYTYNTEKENTVGIYSGASFFTIKVVRCIH